MKVTKRIISTLLAVVMLLGMVPVTTVRAVETEDTEMLAETEAMVPETVAETQETQPAETVATTEVQETAADEGVMPLSGETSGTCGENLTWTITDSTLTISGEGPMHNYSYNSLAPWHNYEDEIYSIILEYGVSDIGNYAFSDCGNLCSVSFSDSTTTIGDHAFYNCRNLISVDIPSSVTEIGDSAFSLCTALSSVVIQDGVCRIGDDAFYHCESLSAVDIPGSVTVIGERAFNECPLVDLSISYGVESIGAYAFCEGRFTELLIPGSVKTIGKGSFEHCYSLATLCISEGVQDIEKCAFMSCTRLRSASLPDSLNLIGDYAFSGCISLGNILIPKNVKDIGNYVFSDCAALSGIWVSESNEYFYNDSSGVLFDKAKTMLIEAPDSIQYCSIPEGVVSINSGAFYHCGDLASIFLPKSVTIIGEYAFYCGFAGVSGEYLGSLSNVYYAGTEQDKNNIDIDSTNEELLFAEWHYSSIGPDGTEPVNNYRLEISPAENLTVEVGQELAINCYLYNGDQLVTDWERPDYSVANESSLGELEYIDWSVCENGYALTLKGISSGSVDMTLYHAASEAELHFTVEVVEQLQKDYGQVTAIEEEFIMIGDRPFIVSDLAMLEGIEENDWVVYYTSINVLLRIEKLRTLYGQLIYWDDNQKKMEVLVQGESIAKTYCIGNDSEDVLLNSLTIGDSADVYFMIDSNEEVYAVWAHEGFVKDVYHVSWLLETDFQGISSSTVRILDRSPSRIVRSNQEVVSSAELWDAVTLIGDQIVDGDAGANFVYEQVELYEAILLLALEGSTDSERYSDWAMDASKIVYSTAKEILDTVNETFMQEGYLELSSGTNLFEMAAEEKSKFIETFKTKLEEKPGLNLNSELLKITKYINAILDVTETVGDFLTMYVNYAILWHTSEATAIVLDQMFELTPADMEHIAMRQALQFCSDMIKENNRIQFENGAILHSRIFTVDAFVVSEGMKYFWNSLKDYALTYAPQLGILMFGYKVGKTVGNVLGNADDIAEQVYKMHIVDRYYDVLNDAIYQLIAQYWDNKNEANATAVLDGLTLLYGLAYQDCQIGHKYTGAIEEALLHKIQQIISSSGTNQFDQYIRWHLEDLQEWNWESDRQWVHQLEFDYPDIFPDYKSMISTSASGTLVVPITSSYSIECPVNVQIYDSTGALVVDMSDGQAHFEGDIEAITIGDRKYINFYGNEQYRIECVGYGSGTMDVTIEESVGLAQVRNASFQELAVAEGTTYELITKTDPTDSMVHTIQCGDTVIEADYDSSFPENPDEHTHEYGEPTFAWDENHHCTATFACVDGDDLQTLDCTVTTEMEVDKIIYTATVEFNGQTYTNTLEEIIETPAPGPDDPDLSDWEYTIQDDCVSIVKYLGEDAHVVVPDSINGLPVTEIQSAAFYMNSIIVNVELPEGIACINNSTFAGCSNLVNIHIPDAVTTIDNAAFQYCENLTEIFLPGSIAEIGGFAFLDCNRLTDVYYGGTEQDRQNIDISDTTLTDVSGNISLENATWHYNSSGIDPQPPEPGPVIPAITGSWTTDLVMSAADLGVSAPDAVLRATFTFNEDGTATTTWEAVDLTAFRMFFHDMFVNAYYAMAYGAGITDLNEIEAFCRESTGMSVSDCMDTLVTDEAMRSAFTPASTSGVYRLNEEQNGLYTDMAIMDVQSDPDVENSFVIGNGTMYLNAASYGKPGYTFVCTRVE